MKLSELVSTLQEYMEENKANADIPVRLAGNFIDIDVTTVEIDSEDNERFIIINGDYQGKIMLCVTRRLIKEGHNLNEEGIPDNQTTQGCKACNNDICCNYIGPACGCKAEDCIDYKNGMRVKLN